MTLKVSPATLGFGPDGRAPIQVTADKPDNIFTKRPVVSGVTKTVKLVGIPIATFNQLKSLVSNSIGNWTITTLAGSEYVHPEATVEDSGGMAFIQDGNVDIFKARSDQAFAGLFS